LFDFLKNRKIQIVFVIIILLVISLISIDRFSKVNIIRNIVTAPVNFVQKGIKKGEDSLTTFFNSIKDYKDVITENEQLKKDVNSLKQKNADINDLQEENIRLRAALLLKNKFDIYKFIGANVLATNPSNYKYEVLIDVGSLDGIKIDDPVVAANNALLGRIYSKTLTSSTVIPITDELSGISGWITRKNGGHVTIRGSIKLKEYGLCLVENIPCDTEIKIGDIIETSGLGGIYPKGIIIGTIVEIFNESSETKKYAYLEPLIQMKILSEVYVISSEDIK